MKTQLLKSIFLCCILHFVTCIYSNAQIIYTDVNPDSTSSNYNLDINNDGIQDFSIHYGSSHICHCPTGCSECYNFTNTSSSSITPLNGNAVADSSNSYPLSLNANSFISSGLYWVTNSIQVLRSSFLQTSPYISYSHGNWTTSAEKYLGLKLIVGANTYYGWARLSVNGPFTIKDYAFNSGPNQPVYAGQPSVVISSISPSNYCAGGNFSIPYSINGTFFSPNVFTAELSNSAGKFTTPVAIGSLNSTTSGIINAMIPTNTPPGSIYKVRVTSSNPARISNDNGSNLSINNALNITITSSTNTSCEPVSLYAPYGYAISYQWKLNGNNISNGTSYTYTATISGNYSCALTSSCGSVTSNSIIITINPMPSATITSSGSTEVCPGSTVLLNANTGTGLTYQWYKYTNNVLTLIPGATNSSYLVTITKLIQVRVTNTFGCTEGSWLTHVYVRKPQASISNNRPLTFCAGDSTVLSTANNPAYTYKWKKNNVNISGATTYKYTAFTSGNYKVKVTNPNGSCDSVSEMKTVTVNCRISDENMIETIEHLSVFPNPATNSLTIKFPSDEAGEISVVNLFGQIVFSEKVNAEQTQIDVSRFRAGMYVVRWSSGENNETKTFSVIK